MSDLSPDRSSNPSSQEIPDPAEIFLLQGQRAFESGNYALAIQQFNQGKAVADSGTALQGELQIWLVTAYEASGDRETALDLCRKVGSYPDMETRKQAKRLLYILEAPKLRMNPEWLTKIPDLTELESNNKEDRDWGRPIVNLSPPSPPKLKSPTGYVIPEPTDPTKVNMGDDRSLLWAMAGAIGILGLVLVLGMQ